MTGTERPESVELWLAEAGSELTPAIEAAQFARLVEHDPPEGSAAAAAIEGFVELFASAAERWETLAPLARASLLARLGERLAALERCGWFVHSVRGAAVLDPAGDLGAVGQLGA